MTAERLSAETVVRHLRACAAYAERFPGDPGAPLSTLTNAADTIDALRATIDDLTAERDAARAEIDRLRAAAAFTEEPEGPPEPDVIGLSVGRMPNPFRPAPEAPTSADGSA